MTGDGNDAYIAMTTTSTASEEILDAKYSDWSSETELPFYFPLPVGTLNSGFQIRLLDSSDNVLRQVSAPSAVTIERNKISEITAKIGLPAEDFSVSIAPGGTSVAPAATITLVDATSAKVVIAASVSEGEALIDSDDASVVTFANGETKTLPVTNITNSGSAYIVAKSYSEAVDKLSNNVSIYVLSSADVTALAGEYTFSAIQALFHYYRTAWINITSTDANSLVLAISDDPTKGNVKLTKIFGFGCDASTSSFVVDHKTTDNLGWKNDKDSDLTGTFAAGTAVYGQYASGSLVFPSPEANAFMTYNGTAVFVEGVYYSGGVSYSNGSFGFTFTSDGSKATLTANPAAIMSLTFDDGYYNADHGIVYVTNNSSFSPTAFVATRSLE